MRRIAVAAVAVATGLAALGGVAAAAERRASLPDIEDEVMCLQCGTALNLSHAPVAEAERQFIRRQIERGRTKEQIKGDLVDRFGPAVLALPEEKGFSLAAYLVPLLVALGAAAAVLVAVRRWSRPSGRSTPAAVIDVADRRRLEGELAAYDRGSPGTEP